MILSDSQQKAEQVFSDFMQDPTRKELVISGSAGTGKTFLTKRLAELAEYHILMDQKFFNVREVDIFYTATTNKAATVLKDTLSENTWTIHALLGLRVKNNFQTGKVELTPGPSCRKYTNVVVFIDEASMINYELLAFIRKYITEKSKIIFIGDPYQLAPVGESESCVFVKPKEIVELKEIQRQVAGSPIIQFSQEFRAILDSGKPTAWPELLKQSTAIQNVSGPELKELIMEEFPQDHEPNDLRILAWSNARVLAYNHFVRQQLTANPDFEIGELVLTNKPIMAGTSILHPTDSIVKITAMVSDTVYGFEGFNVQLNHGYSWFFPKNWKQVDRHLKNLAKDKNWAEYFKIKEEFLDLRALHSVTCHKSQGSTYKKVFIDLTDIGRNNKWHEVARLMYVAISRASEEVYLYGELPIKNWK